MPISNVMLVVTGVSVPEVPVMVIVDDPSAAEAPTVNVITLVAVAGLVANAAVTPVGNPDAARVTLPVNPFSSVTAIVLVPALPGATVTVEGEAASVKLGVPVTVSVMVVEAVSVPEVQVTVIGYAPATTVLLAVRVRTLVVVTGLVLNPAVTPLGKPDTEQLTLPVNGLTSVTVMVSVPLAPGATDRVAADGFSVKLPLPVTVSEMDVVALRVPEVPVIVIG